MDEPNHPRLRKYQHEHTKRWSAKIDEAEIFIFVTAEYDYNYPAPLRNALEYLVQNGSLKLRVSLATEVFRQEQGPPIV